MPTRRFGLQQGDQIRHLEIINNSFWGFLGKATTVAVDGNIIGTIPDEKALREGREFYLDDGSLLIIKYGYVFNDRHWFVTLNGHAAIGSWDDLRARLRYIFKILFICAILEIINGIIKLAIEPDAAHGLRFLFEALCWGGINALLSIFIRRGSLIAVILAFLFNISVVTIFYTMLSEYVSSYTVDFGLTIWYLIFLIYGLVAIVKLRRSKKIEIKSW